MVLGAASSEHAQAAETSVNSIEEVVVTARRREEKLIEVPAAIAAFSGEQLERTGARELKDVAAMVPGVMLNGSGSEAFNTPVIRGLVTLGGTQGGSEPTVAVFYDGAYLLNTSANNIAMLDLERVEIIKGPVNSLYGRPAYAGAFNYVSVKPTDKPDARASVMVGNDGQRKATAVVGGAVVPGVFKVRAAFGYETYDGGYEDPVNHLRQGGFEKNDGQISFALTPTDALDVTGRLYYGKDTFEAGTVTYNNQNCGVPLTYGAWPAGRLSFFCGEFNDSQQPVQIPIVDNLGAVRANDRKVLNSFLRIAYTASNFELQSLTTYTTADAYRFNDFAGFRDGLPYLLYNAAGAQAGAVGLFENFGGDDNVVDFAQELRLSSAPDHALRWNLGAYYADVKEYTSTRIGLSNDQIPAGYTVKGLLPNFNFGQVFLTPGAVPSSAVTSADAGSTMWSTFAGAEYDLTSALTLTGDVRYTSDKREQDNLYSNATPGVYRPFGLPHEKTFTYSTYRASARYKTGAEGMLYATIANGVKSGGFNQRAQHEDEIPYGMETNRTYELGAKYVWLDGRLQTEGALFYITLQDMQMSGPSAYADTVGLVTKNVGAATSKGIEASVSLRATDWLSITAGASLVDATLDSGTYDYSSATICRQVGAAHCEQSRVITVSTPSGARTVLDLSGNQVPRQSKVLFNTELNFNHAIASGWDGFASVRYRYQSKQYTYPHNLQWWGPMNRVSLKFGASKGPITVSGFVENLTNDDTSDLVFQSTFLNDFSLGYFAYRGMARRYGLTVDYKFY